MNNKQLSYLGGTAELAIGKNLIDPGFLGTITVNFAEGTRSTNSQRGVITRPSGLIQTAQIEGNYILPSMDALKVLYEDIYEKPLTDELFGRIRVGGGTCMAKTPKTVNIHYSCEENSDNDFHVFAGLVQLNLNWTYDAENNLVVPFTIFAQPDGENGYAIIGAGDLEQKTLWDHTTEAWIPVGEES